MTKSYPPNYPIDHVCPNCGQHQDTMSQMTDIGDATDSEWENNERIIVCIRCHDISLYNNRNEHLRRFTVNDLIDSEDEIYDTIVRLIIMTRVNPPRV